MERTHRRVELCIPLHSPPVSAVIEEGLETYLKPGTVCTSTDGSWTLANRMMRIAQSYLREIIWMSRRLMSCGMPRVWKDQYGSDHDRP